MEVLEKTETQMLDVIHELGKSFAERAANYDLEGTFVSENYEALKGVGLFGGLVPLELGGLGMSYPEMCNLIRTMAQYCGSTALAFAMHQHLVAASVWKYKHKGVGEATLRKVAERQLVLVSTGARDWLRSNGEVQRTEGGFLVSGKKHFASQSCAGDIAITSAPYLNEDKEWKVLHFPIPLTAKGVSLQDDWDVMGMRGTGSQCLVYDQVFVPEDNIALERDREGFHPVWNVVLTVAMPLIMSVYVGLAEKAVDIAIAKGKTYARNQAHFNYILGKLNNNLISAQTQWKAMYDMTNNFDFDLHQDFTVPILSLKTNVAEACMKTVSEAMEGIGGQSFYRKNGLERVFRDIQAAQFHPLPKWEQYAFCGEKLLAP